MSGTTINNSPPSPTSTSSSLMTPGSPNSTKQLQTTPKSEVHMGKNPLRRSESSRFHEKSSIELQPIPNFNEVSSEERQELLIKKLKQCCNLFDFSNNQSDIISKNIKREALIQCVEYISNAKDVSHGDATYQAIFEMVKINLFRPLPPRINPYGVMYDPEEDEPILEPAWLHIQIVYELFLRFIDSPNFSTHMAKNYVDQKFVLQLLELFDSEDPRERDYLKTTLHRIYGKFIALRGFIRTAIRDLFCTFVYESFQHNGVSEILEVLGSIINGFATPLKDEHKQFLIKVLLPLHKPKSYSVYCSQLGYCITQFIEKDQSLATVIFKTILRQWPIGNSQKEVLFLFEMEDLLNSIGVEQFLEIQTLLFKQLAKCFQSEHFQVAERALLLWSNDHLVSLVSSEKSYTLALTCFYKILHDNANNHWNKTIRTLSFSSLKLFMDIDPDVFNMISLKFNQEEALRKQQLLQQQQQQLLQQQQILEERRMSLTSATAKQINQKPKKNEEQQQQQTQTDKPILMIRRKSLLPVDPSTIAALSSHRSLEDIVHDKMDHDQLPSAIVAGGGGGGRKNPYMDGGGEAYNTNDNNDDSTNNNDKMNTNDTEITQQQQQQERPPMNISQ